VNRATSLYLDLLRFGAALLVLLTHLAYPRFSGGMLAPLRSYGNDAVMLFFVLSGYVIAHTAAHRDRELGAFVLNRCARLYSVALPAVALTVVLDQIGRALAPALYLGFQYQGGEPLLRAWRALCFTHELWFDSWRLFSNGPYWSLGYEFWYYALFACAWYLRGTRRALAPVAVTALVGPKILLLLPVWGLGVLVFRINERHVPAPRVGAALWLASIALYSAFRGWGLPQVLLDWTYGQWGRDFVEHSLRWSNEFLASYVIGLLVAMNIVGMHACAPAFERALVRWETPIRRWAGCSFSLYLFHYPLLQCYAATGGFDPRSLLAVAALGGVTLLSCRALATVTEHRKAQARALLLRVALELRRRLPVTGMSW